MVRDKQNQNRIVKLKKNPKAAIITNIPFMEKSTDSSNLPLRQKSLFCEYFLYFLNVYSNRVKSTVVNRKMALVN